MCGIIGIVSKNKDVIQSLLDSLELLSYRGYDSSGIAIAQDNKIKCIKAIGDIKQLMIKIEQDKNFNSNIGIAHTRWATHGNVTENNAHPHYTDQVAVIHNGTVENFHLLKQELEVAGFKFKSETDSEVIPVLITKYLQAGLEKHIAIRKALSHCQGIFTIIVIFNDEPHKLFGYKKGAPLIASFNDKKEILALSSDIYSIMHLSDHYTIINDDELVILDIEQPITKCNIFPYVYDHNHQLITKKIEKINKDYIKSSDKGEYEHFMLKEIYEQAQVVQDTIESLYSKTENKFLFPEELIVNSKKLIKIIGCGSSYIVATLGAYWLEEIAQINVNVDIASEFRYKKEPLAIYDYFLYISQSGETADIISSANEVKKSLLHKVFALTNNPISSLAQLSDGNIYTKAGVEISVASTKTFIAQMLTFALLSLAIAKDKHLEALYKIPTKINNLLDNQKLIMQIKAVASLIAPLENIFYRGRGMFYPIAMEAALKLKEVAYIHAEALAAGELKHGPIALIDINTHIIAFCPKNELSSKMISNIEEIMSRNGKVIIITDSHEISDSLKHQKNLVAIINIDEEYNIFSSPILYVIIAQLLAYYTALLRGNAIDKPRNLAKSVTVE